MIYVAESSFLTMIADPVRADNSKLIDLFEKQTLQIGPINMGRAYAPLAKELALADAEVKRLQTQVRQSESVFNKPDQLKFCYLLLAFLIGLRLSKTTAE